MPQTRSQKAQQQESMINTQGIPSQVPGQDSYPTTFINKSENSEKFPESTKYDEKDVSEWEFDGIVYLKDTDEFIYDIFTGDNIGYFDGVNILDVEENGVWVLESTKTEILPKEEVHWPCSETELLKIRIKQLKQELKSKDSDIDHHLKVLLNKDKFIQQGENIRTHLIEKLDTINSKYNKLTNSYNKIEVENKALNDTEQTVASVLGQSGAVPEPEESEGVEINGLVMTYSQISEELTRKENVIRRKDAKATRLINIIRLKNLELANFSNKMQEMSTYQCMLSSNMKTLSDENLAWKNYYAYSTTEQSPNTTEFTQHVHSTTEQSPNTTEFTQQGYRDRHFGPEASFPVSGLDGQGTYQNNISNSTNEGTQLYLDSEQSLPVPVNNSVDSWGC